MDQQELFAWIRQQMPAVERYAYFNTGTCGPLPRASAAAIQERLLQELEEGRGAIPSFIDFAERCEAFRKPLAEWIGASPDEVALTQHTTEGMNIVLWGLPWEAGDEIITSTHEHQSLLSQLAILHQRHHVQVRYLPFNGDPEHDTLLLKKSLTRRTRLLAMSQVSWMDGRVFPIAELGRVCRQFYVPVLIDGAQSVGAIPTDVKKLGITFLAVPGQKWLCGPEGTGFLYVDEEWMSRLQMTFTGIMSIRDVTWFDQTSPYFVPAPGARRFEHGGRFKPLMAGLEASFDLLTNAVGWKWIWKNVPPLVQYARESLSELPGVTIVTPEKYQATLLSLKFEHHDVDDLAAKLEKEDVIVRSIHGKENYLRLSIGFFNNEEDVQHLVHALSQLLK
jgi:L-cysteine/cystine lyase